MDAGRLIILNSIIWGNYPDQVRMDGNSWGIDSKLIVSHSDIMGGMNGVYESSNEYFDLIWFWMNCYN